MAELAAIAGEPSGVKSARRTVELLETFAAQDAWLSLSDLHAKTGFPRSSLHGLLRTLYEAGWLEADPGTARYRLGVRALICGTAYLDRDPAIPYATEALEAVRERTGFTAHYARRDGAQVVYLETRESRHSTHLVSRVGRTLPAHATALGKALLAELTQAEIGALFPAGLPALTPRTITSLDGLLAECEATRQRGFAAEVEEGSPGVRCVAAVVPYRIPGTDAMSCSIPVGEVTDAEATHVGELLAQTATELGGQLRRAGIR
ncbi:IclR family transcriptional regulator [Amycolatopsis alkalitolerans]|uniref:Glycerol operon regulatory protein n=1 Tax=Amycolatopsis alkalitolerans TaxID=2547244 RepID=A0A5C4M2U5_9PSEU|nr:IclR family transcriptional regulator [Amycolatopsis alkalitolerans]TNC26548.1 IclR family transcriptional regulator [Amycolatopsis alkalitolerans]